MRNIWIFACKEFLLNIRSYRFMVGLSLCLIIIPFTMIVSISDYQVQAEVCKAEKEWADSTMKTCLVWSRVRPTLVREPEALSLLSRGITNNLGHTISIQLGQIPFLPTQYNWTQNSPFMKVFSLLDFSTILSIMISLLALILSYDAITREREEGTLRFIFSSSVSRYSFLIGKWLGVVLTVLPILLACFLMALGFMVVDAGIRLSGSEWVGIGWMLLAAITYLSVFASFGVWVSSLTTRSVTSIVLCMLCWLGFLFVIPAMSSYLSRSVVSLPAYKQVENRKYSAYMEMMDEINKEWRNMRDSLGMKSLRYLFNYENEDGSKDIRGGSRLVLEHTRRMAVLDYEIRTDYAERMWKLDEEYMRQLSAQRRWQDALNFLSPSSTFLRLLSGVGNTDADAALAYVESVREYRRRFIDFMEERDLFGSIAYVSPCREEVFMEDEEWAAFEAQAYQLRKENLPAYERMIKETEVKYSDANYPYIDTRDIPCFSTPELSGWQRAEKGLPPFLFLLGLSVVWLGSALFIFGKYDLR